MIIRQANQKSMIFITIDIFKGFKFQTYLCNGCHDLIMMSTNLNDVAIINISGDDYRCIISGIDKSKALNLLLTLQKNME